LISLATAASCSNPPDAGTGTTSTTGALAAAPLGPPRLANIDHGLDHGSTTDTTTSTTAGSTTTGGGGTPGTGGGGAGGAGGTPATGGAGGTGTDGGSCLPGVLGHPDCTQLAPPTYAGFTLYLDEDFSAPIDLVNDPIWTYSDGGQPEGDQRFVKDAITFTGGNMVITATARNIASSRSCSELLPNVPNSSLVPNKPHASGEFRTKYNNFRYGRYETSFESPQGQPSGAGGCVPGATASTVCSNS
jgi:hypothetical protein